MRGRVEGTSAMNLSYCCMLLNLDPPITHSPTFSLVIHLSRLGFVLNSFGDVRELDLRFGDTEADGGHTVWCSVVVAV